MQVGGDRLMAVRTDDHLANGAIVARSATFDGPLAGGIVSRRTVDFAVHERLLKFPQARMSAATCLSFGKVLKRHSKRNCIDPSSD